MCHSFNPPRDTRVCRPDVKPPGTRIIEALEEGCSSKIRKMNSWSLIFFFFSAEMNSPLVLWQVRGGQWSIVLRFCWSQEKRMSFPLVTGRSMWEILNLQRYHGYHKPKLLLSDEVFSGGPPGLRVDVPPTWCDDKNQTGNDTRPAKFLRHNVSRDECHRYTIWKKCAYHPKNRWVISKILMAEGEKKIE
jgi:hypothetical protein